MPSAAAAAAAAIIHCCRQSIVMRADLRATPCMSSDVVESAEASAHDAQAAVEAAAKRLASQLAVRW